MRRVLKFLNKYNEKFLFFFVLVISFLFCMFQFLDHDELEAIHTAWKLMHGQVMFVDFFQQKPPFFHYTLIPLIKLFGETIVTIFACKVYMYLLYLLLIYASYLVSISVFGKKTRFLMPVILLCCIPFTDKLTEVRPDVMYMALSMLAVAILFKRLRINNLSLILSGILFGLSFAVLPKAVVYIIPVTAMLFVRILYKKVSISGFIMYLVAMAITVIPFFAHIFKSISFEDYYFFNYSMNFKFLGTFTPWGNLKLFSITNSPFLILSILGFSKLKKYRQKEIGVLALILFASVFTINVPNIQYFTPSVPFLAMIAANFICSIKLLNKNKLIVLLIIAAYPLIYFCGHIFSPRLSWQLNWIQFILDNTTPEDKVYDGSIYFNVFRDDIHYFWFSDRPNGVVDTYKSMRDAEYDVYKEIEAKKPKIIYTKYLDRNHELIKKYYEPTEIYRRVYIRREDVK